MEIIGLDLSINGSGCVKFELDDKKEIRVIDYLSFTQVKKHETEHILHFKKKDFQNSFEQIEWMNEKIYDFCKNAECIAMEGYAMQAKGQVFDIAEFTGVIKYTLWENDIKLRLYDPPSIKKYATTKGNADKSIIEKCYNKLYKSKKNEMFDLTHLPEFKSPRNDIIDAWYIAKLLQLEIKLRSGLVLLHELPEHEIVVFNRCTKKYPVNLLARDFIIKGNYSDEK